MWKQNRATRQTSQRRTTKDEALMLRSTHTASNRNCKCEHTDRGNEPEHIHESIGTAKKKHPRRHGLSRLQSSMRSKRGSRSCCARLRFQYCAQGYGLGQEPPGPPATAPQRQPGTTAPPKSYNHLLKHKRRTTIRQSKKNWRVVGVSPGVSLGDGREGKAHTCFHTTAGYATNTAAVYTPGPIYPFEEWLQVLENKPRSSKNSQGKGA